MSHKIYELMKRKLEKIPLQITRKWHMGSGVNRV